MKSGSVNVMWLPSAKSRPRMFTCSSKMFYAFWTVVAVSWLALAGSAIFIYNLQNDYSQIKEDHAAMTQKASQLDAVMKQFENLKKDETIIRDFLGLEKKTLSESFAGQGGVPNVDLSTIAPEDSLSFDQGISFAEPPAQGSEEIKAAYVAAGYSDIVQFMNEKRYGWEHTPSIMPLQVKTYWISSGFGWRTNPFTGQRDFHNGIDIAGRPQTPIVAPAQGRVTKIGQDKYLGKFVKIDHVKGCETIYGHLAGFNVKKGDAVKRGDVIAYMGNTGLSTGHHVHYIVKMNGKAVNPRRFMLNMGKETFLEG